MKIGEPSADEAVAILLAMRPRLEAHHGVTLNDEALRAAVEWSIRYLPDFRDTGQGAGFGGPGMRGGEVFGP